MSATHASHAPRPPSSRHVRSASARRPAVVGGVSSRTQAMIDTFFERPLTAAPSSAHAMPIGVAHLVFGTPQPLHTDSDRIMHFQPRVREPVVVVRRPSSRPLSAYTPTARAHGLLHARDMHVSRDFHRTFGLSRAFIDARQDSSHLAAVSSLAADRAMLAIDLDNTKSAAAYQQAIAARTIDDARDEKQLALDLAQEVSAKMVWSEDRADELQDRVRDEQAERRAAQTKLTSLTKTHQQLQSDAREQASCLECTKDELRHAEFHRGQLTSHIARHLQPAVNELEEETQQLKHRIGEGRAREDALRAECDAQRQKKQVARTELQRSQDAHEQATMQCDLLRGELRDERQKYATLSSDFSHLRQSSDVLRRAHTELEQRHTQIESQFLSTSSKLQLLMSRESEVDLAIKMELQKLEEAHATLKQAHAAAQADAQRWSDEHQSCGPRAQKQDETIAALRGQVQELQKTIKSNTAASEQRYSSLLAQYSQTETHLHTARSELGHLERRSAQLAQAKLALEKRIRDAEEEARIEAEEEAERLQLIQQQRILMQQQSARASGIPSPPLNTRRRSRASPTPSSGGSQPTSPTPSRPTSSRASAVATDGVPLFEAALAAAPIGRSKAYTLKLLLDRAHDSIADMQRQRDADNDAHDAQVEQMQAQIDLQKSEIDSLRAQLAATELQLEETRKEKENGEQQAAAAAALLRTQLTTAQTNLSHFEQKYTLTVHTNQDLMGKIRSQADDAKRQIGHAESDAREATEKMQQQLDAMRDESREHHDRWQASVVAEAELHARFDSLTAVHADLCSTHAAAVESARRDSLHLQSRASALEAKAYNLNIQFRSMQLHTTGLKLRVDQREQQIARMKAAADAEAAEFARAKQSWEEELHATKERLIATVSTLKAQVWEKTGKSPVPVAVNESSDRTP